MKRICVYCGSSPGARPEYMQVAGTLGKTLAEQNIELVYGGAVVGLMGQVANSVMEHGGRVIGVITEDLDAREVKHPGISELHVLGNMHERKMKMFELSDGFIALPGGFGTLDEMFEMLAWSVLQIHHHACGFLNISGYYDQLFEFCDKMIGEGFVPAPHRDTIIKADNCKDLLKQMEAYQPPDMDAWWAAKTAAARKLIQ